LHAQEFTVNLALMHKIQDSRTSRACQPLRLIRRHPLGVPPHGNRKVTMLATDEARPILDYKPFETIMKKSKSPARKDTKKVSIEIPKDSVEVESGGIGCLGDHAPERFAQWSRPVS
jgi:hypothetical protein